MKRRFKSKLGAVALVLLVGFFGLQPQQTDQLTQKLQQLLPFAQAPKITNQQTQASDAVALANLNYQSGQPPVVQVNHNRAQLDPKSWQTNQVRYANLDKFNRTSQPNTAYLEARNVANDSLRARQTVEPTGWHQKFDGRTAIINRGHLVAYSLSKGISLSGTYDPNQQSGDQNNLKNFFTQTAFSNQRLQTKYETQVRQALRANKKVIYQAQAIFRDNELMPRGVHLQAISTDQTLDFNVYIFNVQPRFTFDYATGRSQTSAMRVPES
ncbi:DNA/RNA non-specific endonuclease [Loigolactobacillus bifermentans]|uniref:DNA RNA non-specific endonuclease n=1 Tax=Loigolactobacillus bifermentans DSM 20003 TaxID=1423726 RepID=A0A0R1GPD1_9LACO|nr:DNA/RNA non-specific endonuclease [Loigolactobacillus bifermentans]KRK33194.1 DNA RNA non-specific endonuclease [Loigolactobacillus bifermentans DSM 20003]QGG60543.1 DNA/RNA non-specific endonuclease [Loigolactobacillus bifermentans]